MDRSYSAALPFAFALLRILIVLNWLVGAAILALLVATVVAKQWTMAALGIAPTSYIPAILPGLQAIAALGLVTIPINNVILKRLLAIVLTVRGGDPFIADNATRLQATAWALLALQLISLAIGGIAKAISTAAHPIDMDAGFSPTGWLAVLLTFVLARIFAEGAQMRDELEGTV
jgi:hypothetical protein